MRHYPWIFLILLSAPQFLLSQELEKGEAAISMIHMTVNSENDLFEDTQRETDLIFRFQQDFVNHGRLEGSLILSNFNEGWEAGSFRFGLRDFWLKNDVGANIFIGDHYFYYRTMAEFFLNHQIPLVFIRGLSVEVSNSVWSTQFFSGKLERRKGITGNSFEQEDESLYGFKHGLLLPRNNFLGIGFLRTEGGTTLSGEKAFTVNNLVLLDGRAWVADGLTILAEYLFSQYNDPARGRKSDSSFIAGPFYRKNDLVLQLNYRNIGRDFQFIGPLQPLPTNQEGVYFDGNLRLKKSHFYGSSDYYWDHPEDELLRKRLSTWASHFGASFYPKDLWYINLGSSIVTRNTSGGPDPIDELRYDVFAGASGHFMRGKLNEYVRFRYREDQREEPFRNTEQEPDMIAGLAWRVTERLRMEWEAEIRSVSNTLRTKDESMRALDFFLHWRPLSTRLSIDPGIEFERIHDDVHEENRNKVAFNLGMHHQLHAGWRLSLTSRYSRYSGFQDRSYLDVRFNVEKTFRWGRPVLRLGIPQPGQKLVCGTIRGYLFIDENADKIRQPWEKGIIDIPVILDDRFVAATDSKGEFSFENVLIGKHSLSIEMQALPLNYSLTSFQQEVEIDVRSVTEAFFPARQQNQ